MSTAAPGWYPDNFDRALVRWWDGTRWTEYTQPAPAALPAPPRQSAAPSFAAAAGVISGTATAAGAWHAPSPQGAGPGQHKMPGGKRELQAEVERLRRIVEGMGIERLEAMRSEARLLDDALPRLRREQGDLVAALAPLRAEAQHLSAQRAEAAGIEAGLAVLRARSMS